LIRDNVRGLDSLVAHVYFDEKKWKWQLFHILYHSAVMPTPDLRKKHNIARFVVIAVLIFGIEN